MNATHDSAVPSSTGSAPRIRSLDLLRGCVMILMAIDHVRVYAGVPPGGPDPAVFFTRWVTHFCAPVFIFVAGTSAYFAGRKMGSRPALSKWLVSRGLFLVLLELTVLRFAWTFNLDWMNFTFAGVIWAIGWCMVILAAFVWLPIGAITAIGIIVVALHNAAGPALFQYAESAGGAGRAAAMIFYAGGVLNLGEKGPALFILYSLVPWFAVMALGYSFGTILERTEKQRDKACVLLGAAAIALFVILRSTNIYGDPRPFESGVMSFLNTSKYPASLQFLLMTIGPALLFMPVVEKARGRIAEWIQVFGRVPFFYYLLHIPLIHLIALGIASVRTPESAGWLFSNHPMNPPQVPDGYRWSLPLLYAVTAGVVVILYPLCRWYSRRKAMSSNTFFRFL